MRPVRNPPSGQRRHLIPPTIAGLLGAGACLYWHLGFTFADTTVFDTTQTDIAYARNWVLRILIAGLSFAVPFCIVYVIILLLPRKTP